MLRRAPSGHRIAAILCALLLSSSCMMSNSSPSPRLFDPRSVLDLTYEFGPDTIYWPTGESFHLERRAFGPTEEGYFYSANDICMAEHGGTHMDAPLHFAEGGLAAADVPLSSCIGPAVVIDVRQAVRGNPDYELSIDDLRTWEEQHGPIPPGAIVIQHSGWGTHWGNRKAYLGSDVEGDVDHLHFPAFSVDAVRFLVEQRNIAAIAVDTASVDPGPSRDFPVHRVLAAAGRPGFENVAHVDRLPPVGALFVALPIKVAGGSGGPARIVAFLPGTP